jgi:hypothetical protein
VRSIAIIGAGQAGLQLAIALVKQNYDVTLYSDRTPGAIQAGHVMSSQGMFDDALQIENFLGLNFWHETCPDNLSVTFSLSRNSEKLLAWKALTHKPFRSIDQRLKFPKWMQVFEQWGGKLCIQKISTNDLEGIANKNDLTIISTGKKELSNLFTRDEEKSPFKEPMRKLACLYVNNIPTVSDKPGIRVNIIPGVGEFFIMPGLTLNGACEMMLFEAIPGKAFDCWNGLNTPDEHLNKAKELLAKFLPWEAERCKDAKLTDEKGYLTGSYAPVVRKPVFKLASGAPVLGMGDTVVLNDPVAGQGANNASKCADIYFKSIKERGNGPFDANWMENTFNTFWGNEGQWATLLSNSHLTSPTKTMIGLLSRAASDPEVAKQFANGFANPKAFFKWVSACEKKQILEVHHD